MISTDLKFFAAANLGVNYFFDNYYERKNSWGSNGVGTFITLHQCFQTSSRKLALVYKRGESIEVWCG